VRLSAGYVGTLTLRMGRLPVDRETAGLARQLGSRLGLRREVGVFISGRVVEATVVGFLRPIVLLPLAWLSELPPDVLEAVLAHELAHVRRHDLWINLAQRLVETLLFFHPCIWWVSERLRLEREMCCDDLAVAVTGRPGVYAETLELVALRRRSAQAPFLATAFGGKRMSLLRRVRNVLGQEPPQGGRWWPVGIVALLLVSGFAAATVDVNSKLWAQDDAQDNDKAARADKRRDARQSRQLKELNEVVRKLQEELATLKVNDSGNSEHSSETQEWRLGDQLSAPIGERGVRPLVSRLSSLEHNRSVLERDLTQLDQKIVSLAVAKKLARDEKFTNKAVEDALMEDPEIREMETQIRAQKRLLAEQSQLAQRDNAPVKQRIRSEIQRLQGQLDKVKRDIAPAIKENHQMRSFAEVNAELAVAVQAKERMKAQLDEITKKIDGVTRELAQSENAAAPQRHLLRQQLQLVQAGDSEKAWAKEREDLMARIRELEERLQTMSDEREGPRAERERERAEANRENARRKRAEAIEREERERRVKARKEKPEGGDKGKGPQKEALRRAEQILKDAQQDQKAKTGKLRAEREEITRHFQDAMKQFHKEMESHHKMLGKQRQEVMRDLNKAARELAEQARQKHQALGKEQREAVEQLRQAVREGGNKEALMEKRDAIQRQFHEAAEHLRRESESQQSQLHEKQEAVARELEEAARRFEEEMRTKSEHMREEHHRALEQLQRAIEEQHRSAAESPLDHVEGAETLLGGVGVDAESLEALLAESSEVREEALHAAMEVQDEIAALAGEHAAEMEEQARLASEGAAAEVEEALREVGESYQEIEEEVRLAEEETMIELEQAQHELDEELQAAEEEALIVEEEVQREAEEATREAVQEALEAEEEARRASEEEQQEQIGEGEDEDTDEDNDADIDEEEEADEEEADGDDDDPAERALRALEERLRALERELELHAPRVEGELRIEGQLTEGIEGLLDDIRVRLELTSEDAGDEEVEIEVELDEVVTDEASYEADEDETDDDEEEEADEEEAEVEEEQAALGHYLRLVAGVDGISAHPAASLLGILYEKMGIGSVTEKSSSNQDGD
jgi:hypothetical protein